MAKWYYSVDGRAEGPVEAAVIAENLKAGKLTLVDLVFKDGDDRWRTLGEVPEFSQSLTKTTLPPSPQQASLSGGPYKFPPGPVLSWVVLRREPADAPGAGERFTQSGPHTIEQIEAMLASGQCKYADYAWRPSYKRWVRIGNLPEFDRRRKNRDGDKTPEIVPLPQFEIESAGDSAADPAEPAAELMRVERAKSKAPQPELPPPEAEGPDLVETTQPGIERESLFAAAAMEPEETEDEGPGPDPHAVASERGNLAAALAPLADARGQGAKPGATDDDDDVSGDDQKTVVFTRAQAEATVVMSAESARRGGGGFSASVDPDKTIVHAGPLPGQLSRFSDEPTPVPETRAIPAFADAAPRPPSSQALPPHQAPGPRAAYRDGGEAELGAEELEEAAEDYFEKLRITKRRRLVRAIQALVAIVVLVAAVLFFGAKYLPGMLNGKGEAGREARTEKKSGAGEGFAQRLSQDGRGEGASDPAPVKPVPVAVPEPTGVGTVAEAGREGNAVPSPKVKPSPAVVQAEPSKPAPAPEPAEKAQDKQAADVPVRLPGVKPIPPAAGKASTVEIVAVRTDPARAFFAVNTNAPVGATIQLTLSARSGEVLNYPSFFLSQSRTRSGGEVPTFDFSKVNLAPGQYRVEAQVGEVRRSRTIFLGVKNQAFFAEMERHLKRVSYQQQREKKALLSSARKMEELSQMLGEKFTELRSDSARWQQFYSEWNKEFRRASSLLGGRVTVGRRNQFAFPDEAIALQEAIARLQEQASAIHESVISSSPRELAGGGTPEIIREFARLRTLTAAINGRVAL